MRNFGKKGLWSRFVETLNSIGRGWLSRKYCKGFDKLEETYAKLHAKKYRDGKASDSK